MLLFSQNMTYIYSFVISDWHDPPY